MASVRSQFFNLTGVDKAAQLRGRMVNWNFFHLLGVQPQLGRLFVSEDDRYGAARTALLSHGMWQEKFGGEAGVIGRKLLLDGDPYELIGVLPPGFEYFRADDVFVPIGLLLGLTTFPRWYYRGAMWSLLLARLKPGVTLEQASNELAGIAAQLEREYPATNRGRRAQAEALQDVMSESVRQLLWVLLSAVGFILLIACVNVANLLLVRAAERQKEIALRLRSARVADGLSGNCSAKACYSLCWAESSVSCGSWMLEGLLALAPGNIPQLSRVRLNLTVLLFTLGLSALTSVLCGLLPALHASAQPAYGAERRRALRRRSGGKQRAKHCWWSSRSGVGLVGWRRVVGAFDAAGAGCRAGLQSRPSADDAAGPAEERLRRGAPPCLS